MSCTMTMDLPESAVSFVSGNGKRSRSEIGELFMSFLVERMGYVPEKHDNPFSAFCGTWDEGQFEEFQKATQRTVSPDDWK